MSKRPTAVRKKTEGKKKSDELDINAIFEMIDLNHDGRISVYELTKAARLLGFNPTKKEAEAMIEECNPTQKGYVNKSEFKKVFEAQQTDVDEQMKELQEAFRVFDKDNSGTISREEIRTVLSMAGEKIDDEELDQIIKKVDLDGDGIISIEEFAAVMCEF